MRASCEGVAEGTAGINFRFDRYLNFDMAYPPHYIVLSVFYLSTVTQE